MTKRRSIIQEDIAAIGEYPGVSVLNKFSYRSNIDISDGDAMIIADNTTNTPNILLSPSTFTVTYDNSLDGSGSTGAHSLRISYLDENQELQEGDIDLRSSGSVVTTFSGLGINRAVLISSGSSDINNGDISISASSNASMQAHIPAGSSVTNQLLFHVAGDNRAVGKFLFLGANKLSGGSSPVITFKVFVYSRLTQTRYEVFRYSMDTDVENSLSLIDPVGFLFTQGDVVWVTAATNSNGANAEARLSSTVYEI